MIENSLFQKNFFKILENFTDGILIIDADRNIVYCNNTLCHLYGITKGELTNKNAYFPVEKGWVDNCLTELVFSTKKAVTYEQTNKKGKLFISTASPVTDSWGNIIFILEQVRSMESIEFYSPEFAAEVLDDGSNRSRKEVPPRTNLALAEFKSIVMQNVYKLADNMATKNINILILGVSGTGKSQLAKRIHENSARRCGPFVTINCAAIPETLIESELFGYVKGAFSGASNKGKPGLVEVSDGGTLFLDEIGELPLGLQSKLLQFVQEKTYIPVGGVRPIQVDTRIIAATNRDITELIGEGVFREDLYYRLATVTIHLPPLKERPEDVCQLLNHFCHELNLKHETDVMFSKDVEELLCDYLWPGNIREMEHLVEFLILSCQTGYITPNMLPSNFYKDSINTARDEAVNPKAEMVGLNLLQEPEKEIFRQMELFKAESLEEYMYRQKGLLINALYPEFGNSYKLSERLKISQSTASRLIRKHIKSKKA